MMPYKFHFLASKFLNWIRLVYESILNKVCIDLGASGYKSLFRKVTNFVSDKICLWAY